MKRRPFYETQAFNPARRPNWRWERAQALLATGRYFSKKRDDRATGIAVEYMREMAKSFSELRLRRVRQRFEHVDRAREEFEAIDGRRLELETRMLARQTDAAIGFELGLPAETVQAYRDLFFHIDDRINATSYILFHIIGLHPSRLPHPVTLMQASAYFHGSEVIEPWFSYLRNEWNGIRLDTERDRILARIALFVDAHSLPDTPETRLSLLKTAPIVLKNSFKSSKSVPACRAFAESTSRIGVVLGLPASKLPLFSYAPGLPERVRRQSDTQNRNSRKAA